MNKLSKRAAAIFGPGGEILSGVKSKGVAKGIGRSLKKMPWYVTIPALVATTIGAEEIQQKIHKSITGRKQKKAFMDMYSVFPELKDMDKKEVETYFDVIKQYAPTFAAHPVTAGSLVKQMVSMKGTIPERLLSLIKAEKELRDVGPKPADIISGILGSAVPKIM
jgi:hypothetical protein